MVGGVEAVVFGLLVFVVGVLVVANAWGVIDAKMAAAAAAREAARAYVKAPSADDALDLGIGAGQATLSALGRHDPGNVVALVSGTFVRCATVTFRVTVPVPLVALPWLGHQGHGFTATAIHSEVVDPFRSGVPGAPNQRGAADCG